MANKNEFVIEIKLVDGELRAKIPGITDNVEKMNNSFKKAEKTVNRMNTTMKKASKTNEDMISSAGLAGATLVEFGRTISDLPFGITAITNNLSQLSTLFVTLVAKTGGTTKALNLLFAQMAKGPLGIILVFQVLISLLQQFQDQIMSVFKSSDELNEATKELTKTYDDLIEKIRENNEEVNKQDESFQELVERLMAMRGTIELVAAGVGEKSVAYKAFQDLRKQIEATTGAAIDFTDPNLWNNLKALKESTPFLDQAAESIINLRKEIERGRITGGLTPVQIAQKRLDLYILEQESFAVEAETYLKSEEYSKLLARLERAKKDAQDKADKQTEKDNELIRRLKRQIESLGLLTDEELEILQLGYKTEDAKKKAGENAEALQLIEELHEKELLRITNFYANQRKGERINNENDLRQLLVDEKNKTIDALEDNEIKAALRRVNRQQADAIGEAKALGATKDQLLIIEQNYHKRRMKILGDFAEEELQLSGKSAIDQLEQDVEEKEETLTKFQTFLKHFGDNISEAAEALAKIAALAISASLAQIDAEISAEERKTTLLNNELKKRLRNEQLTADQKEAIYNEIEANEVALQEKRDELAERQFKIQKSVSIVETLIATYEMATKAYKALVGIPIVGPALAVAAAAAATKFGLKQVDAISQTQFVPSAAPGAVKTRGIGGSTGAGQQAPSFNIVGTGQQFQLGQAIAQRTGEPVKAFVVSNDITTAQELDRNIITGSAIG
jgi:hypothetical protein